MLISLLSLLVILAGCAPTLGPEPEVLAEDFTLAESSTGFMPEGQVLGGSSPYYIEFNEADFNTALATQELVILNFYANWCPSCKAEDKEIRDAFREGNLSDTVVVFRTSFRDSDTSEFEKSLAEEYQVITQGTKIIFVNGVQVEKTPQHFSKEQYVELFSSY